MNKALFKTFKRGSTTYFYSSVFFPPAVRSDVSALYAFVRTADDFVDAVPQQPEAFYRFRASYYEARAGGAVSSDVIIGCFVELMNRKCFDPAWVDAFLRAMEMDLKKQSYDTIEETCEYMYGSAEVIGLMMATIMGLHADSLHYARLLGRSMQYINFIRDIDEDFSLGRRYLPLAGTGLSELSEPCARKHPERFTRFIHSQLQLYEQWQTEAEKGFSYIPKRYLVPIKTASDKYKWTGRTIRKNPLVVFEKKVKPPALHILLSGICNAFTIKTTCSYKQTAA